MASSKKGISAHQLHRTLQVTYKTAWFMAHRMREAMATGGLNPFGSDGGMVEVDEAFIANDRTIKPKGEKYIIAKKRAAGKRLSGVKQGGVKQSGSTTR